MTACVVASDHRLDSGRFQYAFRKIRIETTSIGSNDDKFRFCSKTVCFKASGNVFRRRWGIHGEMVDQFDITIRAPNEADTILRFALGAEHWLPSVGQCVCCELNNECGKLGQL